MVKQHFFLWQPSYFYITPSINKSNSIILQLIYLLNWTNISILKRIMHYVLCVQERSRQFDALIKETSQMSNRAHRPSYLKLIKLYITLALILNFRILITSISMFQIPVSQNNTIRITIQHAKSQYKLK